MSTSEYPSYLDLLEKHQGRLSYEDKLSCLEWREKRNIIIDRDGNLCRSCGKSHYLEVHHTFYALDCLPWQYSNDSDCLPSEESNDSLITLCNNCHEKWHEKHTPRLYKTLGGILLEVTKCKRCKGVGRLPKYNHRDNGICYKCYGERYEELKGKSLVSQIPETIQDNYVQEEQDGIYDNNQIPENELLIFLQEEYKKELEEWLNS